MRKQNICQTLVWDLVPSSSLKPFHWFPKIGILLIKLRIPTKSPLSIRSYYVQKPTNGRTLWSRFIKGFIWNGRFEEQAVDKTRHIHNHDTKKSEENSSFHNKMLKGLRPEATSKSMTSPNPNLRSFYLTLSLESSVRESLRLGILNWFLKNRYWASFKRPSSIDGQTTWNVFF